jgi:hypothetical protein
MKKILFNDTGRRGNRNTFQAEMLLQDNLRSRR